MKDLAVALDNRPGALAEMGDALGRAGVSIEGGGAFVVNGEGVAHFLFKDGEQDADGVARAIIGTRVKRILPNHLFIGDPKYILSRRDSLRMARRPVIYFPTYLGNKFNPLRSLGNNFLVYWQD